MTVNTCLALLSYAFKTQPVSSRPWDRPIAWPKPEYELNFDYVIAHWAQVERPFASFWGLIPREEKGYLLRAVSEGTCYMDMRALWVLACGQSARPC